MPEYSYENQEQAKFLLEKFKKIDKWQKSNSTKSNYGVIFSQLGFLDNYRTSICRQITYCFLEILGRNTFL